MSEAADHHALADLLGPGPLIQARLDVTTNCNLRCVYCAVSHPSYVGVDMPLPLAGRASALIAALAQHYSNINIAVNGHGETTFARGWTDLIAPLLDRDLPVSMTSNLAKVFTPHELDVLSRFRSIAVSIDTADQALLQRFRRKVSLRHIVRTIGLIRAAALADNRPEPRFTFLAGLYSPCSATAADLAELAISLRVSKVCYWDLKVHDYAALDLPADTTPQPMESLDDAELRRQLGILSMAFFEMRANGVQIEVHADFLNVLAARRGIRVIL